MLRNLSRSIFWLNFIKIWPFIQVLEGFKVFLQYFHIWKIDNALWRPCFLSDWHNLYNFCTQALEEQFGENQIEIRLLVLEKKIFKDFVRGCHGNKGNYSAQYFFLTCWMAICSWYMWWNFSVIGLVIKEIMSVFEIFNDLTFWPTFWPYMTYF